MVESLLRRASRPYLSDWWQDLGFARSKHGDFRDGHPRVSVVVGGWWIFHTRGVEVLLCMFGLSNLPASANGLQGVI